MRFFVLFMLLAVVSCSTSKYQNGFVYKPAHQAPGFSGNMTEETASSGVTEAVSELPPAAGTSAETSAFEGGHTTASHATGEKTLPATGVDVAADHAIPSGRKEQAATATVSEPVNTRQILRELAESYAVEKQVTLSDKQLRKLDRYAAKLEKKQQKMADVDWAPRNNLEIFVLAAAGVGVIVGLFSGIGWFIFAVAALAYLYLKLLA